MARLLYLDQYPDLCRLALGARGEVCTVEIEQAKKIAKADCLAVQATKTGGWEWKPWTAALTIGAAALSGVAVGIVVGMTAWR